MQGLYLPREIRASQHQVRIILGAKATSLSQIHLPCLVSYKYDGWRGVWQGLEFFSRSAKTIPNRALRSLAASLQVPPGWDGEIIVGEPTAPSCFSETDSFCKTLARPVPPGGVRFFAFDNALASGGFLDRYSTVYAISPFVTVVEQELIERPDDLEALEAKAVALGYEGICTRKISGPYKQGRSTLKEQYLVKVKRYIDEDVIIKALEPRYHNANPAFISETGYTKRSSHADGKIALDTLGAIVADWRGKELRIGTGWDSATASSLWALRHQLPGRRAEIRFSPPTKDLPRQPVFKRLRND